jgi:hypothetical protein
MTGSPRSRRSWLEIGANVALMLASSALVLLAGECGTRRLSRIGPSLLVTDPAVGKRYVAGFVGRVFVDEAEAEVELRFSREGFRGPDRALAKPPGTFRIAVVGDSMVAAVATPEDRTLVDLLEGDLRRALPETGWEVMNFGVSSASTGQELVLYRQTVSRYDPDLVLLWFFVGNDLGDNCSRLTSAPRIYFELDARGGLEQGPTPRASTRLVRWLDLHSRLYVWQKVALRRIRAQGRRMTGEIEPGQRIFSAGPDLALDYAWRLTSALLREIALEVERGGGRFGVVVVPCAEQVYDDLWAELEGRAARRGEGFDRDLPGRRLLEICRSAAIPALSLEGPFRAYASGRSSSDAGARLFLGGRFHLSDEGHRLAAQEVFAFLTQGAGRCLLTAEADAADPM